MTQKQLLTNLKNAFNYINYSFKVLAKMTSDNATRLFILVSNDNGAPLFVLDYLKYQGHQFLADATPIGNGHLYGDKLKAFEDAIKE